MKQSASVHEFSRALEEGKDTVAFIDVRSPAEYRSAHIKGVINVPLDLLDKHIADLSKKDAVFVHCKSGARSAKACEVLSAYHLDNIRVMEGGIDEWQKAGLAVEKGKAAISIQRQVQIVAGGLTVSGVVLGFATNPSWFLLSGFVGAGLLFAGISNTCLMADLLCKMPWNR